MASAFHPTFDPALDEAFKSFPNLPATITLESLQELRTQLEPLYTAEKVFTDPEFAHEDITISGPDGEIILAVVKWKKSQSDRRPCLYYMHGGGMILGNRFTFGDALDWVKELRAILVSVEYRMPPEHPHPAPVEDCYAGLKWISEHASELGINEVRIMTVGPFGGGCVAAGLALLARDRGGPRIHAQCLPYPMLDDRMENVSSKQYFNIGKWQGGINEPAWNFLLDGKRGAEDVSIYAAPARATDLSRLPPTWLDVGAAELFRDEVVAYASKLWEGGVQAELHVWPGCWHAFDAYAPDSALSRLSRETRMKWMKRVLLS